MLSLFRRPAHKEVTPHALAAMLAAGEAILVDVREADEFASGHVAGALSMPLSRFQASALPAGGKPVILTCAAGRRSAMALD
ncbi:MAG: sulfurtransferase, partial [Sphingopyxis sp. 65-8]